jgi:catechol 2,3-dioxygenase-like lactoylglutathione lyase family enzyme
MKPRVNVVTLAVDDLERALAFYRDGLGLPTRGVIATQYAGTDTEPAGAVVFFELQGGLVLALYPRTELAKDARVPPAPASALEFSLGVLADSRQEVEDVLAQAAAAGGTVTDAPHDRPWGIYSGYFQDPDGHLWEIIWNPKTPG